MIGRCASTAVGSSVPAPNDADPSSSRSSLESPWHPPPELGRTDSNRFRHATAPRTATAIPPPNPPPRIQCHSQRTFSAKKPLSAPPPPSPSRCRFGQKHCGQIHDEHVHSILSNFDKMGTSGDLK